MRGLTDEERQVLAENVRIGTGTYVYFGAQDKPEIYDALVERACLRTWVEESYFAITTKYDPTSLGELALRADAAARAAGLWPL